MRRPLRWVLGTALACVALLMLYLLGGMSGPGANLVYVVDVAEPGAGSVRVSILVTPPARPWLTLWLRDARMDGRERLSSLSVTRDGRAVPTWQAVPGYADARNVWTGFSRQRLTLTYDVDARWMKGEAPRSYLGPEFGYLRGMVVLYTPVTPRSVPGMITQIDVLDDGAGRATVRFLLPGGWSLISPWDDAATELPVAHLRNVYFGVGPMSVATVEAGDSALRLGVYTGLEEAQRRRLLDAVPALFQAMQARTGLAPHGPAPYWTLTVVPADVIHGGASGTSSLVTGDTLDTISHEMFHWWNGDTVTSLPEANWFKEGFTTYYEGKMLVAAGVWSEDQLADHLNDFAWQLWPDEQPIPVDLIQASEDLRREGTRDAYNRVYYGGALLARFLDGQLHAQDRSLDEIWGLLDATGQPVSNESFVEAVASLGGEALARTCDAIVHGREAVP